MPAYDYDCEACGRRFEVSHGVHADPPTTCPLCGKGPIRKAISAPAIHYQGSGWAKKERRATATPSSSRSTADGSSSEGGTSETGSVSEKTSTEGSDKPKKSTEAATASTTD